MEIKIKEELLQRANLQIEQLFYKNEANGFNINRACVLKEEGCEYRPGDYIFTIKLNFCNSKGEILHILHSNDMEFQILPYSSFMVSCFNAAHFVDVNEWTYLELYPSICRRSDAD